MNQKHQKHGDMLILPDSFHLESFSRLWSPSPTVESIRFDVINPYLVGGSQSVQNLQGFGNRSFLSTRQQSVI